MFLCRLRRYQTWWSNERMGANITSPKRFIVPKCTTISTMVDTQILVWTLDIPPSRFSCRVVFTDSIQKTFFCDLGVGSAAAACGVYGCAVAAGTGVDRGGAGACCCQVSVFLSGVPRSWAAGNGISFSSLDNLARSWTCFLRLPCGDTSRSLDSRVGGGPPAPQVSQSLKVKRSFSPNDDAVPKIVLIPYKTLELDKGTHTSRIK